MKVRVLEDKRLPSDDIVVASIAPDALHFGIPKAFKFNLWYEYGAAVDVANVLQGTIKGRVRIRFAFFSRTWRKQIARFKGWTWHYELLKGGNDLSVSIGKERILGTQDGTKVNRTEMPALEMGLSESEVPLTALKYLEQSVPTDSADGGVADDGGIPDSAPDCAAHCSSMAASPVCRDVVVRFLGCLRGHPVGHWECDPDGMAAIREPYCADEQAKAVGCLEAEYQASQGAAGRGEAIR